MIVATAGHVDHGKTALVRALTGVDTDRLPEEKERGMTIDLGFAYRPTPDGRVVGFVDVPGHERFVHNMLCGVAGIDFALLVVAADDGPMPQTLEHVSILDLLGVARGAVAVTKIDRVAPQRLAEATESIEELLEGTSLRGSPIFPLSVLSGAGLEALSRHLDGAAAGTSRRAAQGNFRLCVDRCFTKPGAGLIVTGTATSGSIAAGEAVRVLLRGAHARVRAVHAQNREAARGFGGERCALNLAGIDGKIERGEWIAAGDIAPPVRKLDARLRVVDAGGLAHWTPVHVHLGAADVTGRVALLEGARIEPGAAALVQLVLDRPIGALGGDRFIVRDQSATRTLGGGAVVDVFPPPRGRTRPERLACLRAMESPGDEAALEALLGASPAGVDLSRFAMNRNLTAAAAHRLFARARTVACADGLLGFSQAHWSALRARALATVGTWHEREPDAPALAVSRIVPTGQPRVARELADALADELVGEGMLAREPTGVRLPSHRAVLSDADLTLWRALERLLDAPRPATVFALAGALGLEPARLEAALGRMALHGLVVRVSKNRFFLPAAVRALERLALESAGGNGSITAAGFRDRSGLGRNLTIEVLEFFDRVRFTRRAGDRHVLVRKASKEGIGRDSHPGGAPGLQIQREASDASGGFDSHSFPPPFEA